MASGNPDRARRDRKAVDYTDSAADKAMSEAMVEAFDDHSTLDVKGAPKELDVNEDRRVDKTFRPTRVVEEEDSDEYDSDEFEEDEEGNFVRSTRKKKEKTDAEVAAEMAVAEGLNQPYPKGFIAMRKGLHYMFHAACMGSRRMGVRFALDRLEINTTLSDADREWVIATAQTVADTVRVPKAALAKVFEPLSNFNGGIFAKTGYHMPLIASIVMAVEMYDQLADFRAKGSAQSQGFAALLGHAGLGGDVVAMLTQAHTSDTPEDSARACGQKLAGEINALGDEELVQALYFNVANFKQRVVQFQPEGHKLTRAYDYSHFDNTKPKGQLALMKHKGVVSVSVSVLNRSIVTDASTKSLESFYGTDALPCNAGYKEIHCFADSPWLQTKAHTDEAERYAHANVEAECRADTAWQAADGAMKSFQASHPPGFMTDEDREEQRKLSAARNSLRFYMKRHLFAKKLSEFRRAYDDAKAPLGYYAETHRAQKDVLLADKSLSWLERGKAVCKAVKSMLLTTTEGNADTAPKLKAYLDKRSDRKDKKDGGLDPRHTNYWGVKKDAYLAVKFDGVATRLGRLKERNRSIHVRQSFLREGVVVKTKAAQLQKWLKIDEHVDVDSFVELMLPPWKLKATGTVEFFLLLTDTPPEDVICLKEPRQAAYDRRLTEAKYLAGLSPTVKAAESELKKGFYAATHKGKNPDGIEKRRLKPLEKAAVQQVKRAARDAAGLQFKAANPTLASFSMCYPTGSLWDRTTAAKRARDKEACKATKQAKAHHKYVVAANPDLGGGDIDNTTGFGSTDTYTAGAGSSTDPME